MSVHRHTVRGAFTAVCSLQSLAFIAACCLYLLCAVQPTSGAATVTVQARRRLLSQGLEADFVDAIAGFAAAGADDAVLEVGCGEGQHLAAIAARSGCEGHGLDISVATIAAAARRHPRLGWVVANADRFLPYADASFRVVTSVTARTNAVYFRLTKKISRPIAQLTRRLEILSPQVQKKYPGVSDWKFLPNSTS